MSLCSVIIPTYNRAHMLPDAIESVLRQTYRNYEILVIDDGSTDETQRILQQYCKQYPSAIKYLFQENSGHSSACNRGMEMAKGDFIAFLDSDDVFLPEKIERYLSYFSINPDAALLMGRMTVMDEKGCLLAGYLKPKNAPGWDLRTLLQKGGCSTSSYMIRKEIANSVRWDEGAWGPDDLDFALQVASRHKILIVDELLSIYREHPQNSLANKTRSYHDQIYWWNKWQYLYSNILEASFYRKKLSQLHYLLATELYRKGDYSNCRHHLSESLSRDVLVGKSFTDGASSIIKKLLYIVKPWFRFGLCLGAGAGKSFVRWRASL